MNISNSPPPRYDKEQPTSTPYMVRRPLKKRRSLVKQLIDVGKQRPFLLLFLGLGGLCVLGWLFSTPLSRMISSLSTSAKAGSENQPSAIQTPLVIKPSPTVVPAKAEVAISATPTATPTVTPSRTPQVTPTPLETKQANVTAPVTAGKGRFAVQVGAYQDQAEAASNLARMKGLGLDARMISVTLLNKGLWHRIQVGRFETRDAASRFGQQLQSRKAISGFMVTEYK